MSPGGSRFCGLSGGSSASLRSPCSLGVFVAACDVGCRRHAAGEQQRQGDDRAAQRHRVRRPNRRSDSGSTPELPISSSRLPIEWEEFAEGVDVGDARRPDRLRRSRGPHLRALPRPPPRRRARRADRFPARRTPAGRDSAAASSPSSPSSCPTTRSCSTTSTSSGGILAAPARASRSIDCIDDYDRFFAEPDITPDDRAGEAGSRRPRRGVRR